MQEGAYSRVTITGNYNAVADRGGVATVNVTEITYKDVQPRSVDAGTLERARRRFEELPLDGVPDPAPLPRVSLMPFGANSIFVGREKELKALAVSLKGGATAVITGL